MMPLNNHLKRPFLFILLCFISFFSLSTSMYAKDTKRVFDDAGLLSDLEVTGLEKAITDIENAYKLDIVVVTTSDDEGKSSQEYADDFYDNEGFGYNDSEDGILLLIDMDARELAISTAGKCIDYFDDERINTMLNDIAPYLSDAKYYNAASRFLKEVKAYMEKGIPGNHSRVEQDFQNSSAHTVHQPFTNKYGDPFTPSEIGLSAIVAAIAAFIVALITRCYIAHRYKHPKFTTPKVTPDHSSIKYTEKKDAFLTTHTSRVRIKDDSSNNNNSGGGGSISSIHTSSSGSTHGGGSRGF